MRQTAQRAAMTATQQARGSSGPSSFLSIAIPDGDNYHFPGITNITSTADPFYSAGGPTLAIDIPKSDHDQEVILDGYLNGVALLVADEVTVGAGGAAGSYTLTDTEAAYETIVLTGVLTGNRNVIVPDLKRRWIVVNDCTGAFTMTVKTAAGSGIVVGAAKSAIFRCNGVNVTRVTLDA